MKRRRFLEISTAGLGLFGLKGFGFHSQSVKDGFLAKAEEYQMEEDNDQS